MVRKEAVRRLEEIINEIYDKLEEIEEILKEVAPEELGAEEVYWISHIDEDLLNLLEDARRSFINMEDILLSLELEEEEEE